MNPLNVYPRGFTVILQLAVVLRSRWHSAIICILVCGALNEKSVNVNKQMTLFHHFIFMLENEKAQKSAIFSII